MAKTQEEKAAILAEKEAAKEATKTSAVVVNAQGLHVRTFNLADHGEGFAELALGYAKKVKGKVL